MKVGIVGLGAMGSRIAQRLSNQGISVLGYDPHAHAAGVTHVAVMRELLSCDIIWIMIPHTSVDRVVDELISLNTRALIIDGGNSYYRDSIARAERCAKAGIAFLDCGVSGGIIAQEGYCLTVGGDRAVYCRAEQLFLALAAPHSLTYCGASGAGHFVKMVHNAIEYSLLQAYAEGFELLMQGPYSLDIQKIAEVWNAGSLIESRLLGVFAQALRQSHALARVSGSVSESGMGEWAAREAAERMVAMPALTAARDVRAASRTDASRRSFATRLIHMARHIFGGHAV